MALQLDPYYHVPLWPDAISLAALQARAMLDSGAINERDMAEVVAKLNTLKSLAGTPLLLREVCWPAWAACCWSGTTA